MDLAFAQAKKAAKVNEVPVGAVVVLNGKVIAKAYNLREKKQLVLTHAELIVIEKAAKKLKSWRLEGCEMYVTLEPCPLCAAALWQARIRKVYFGAIDSKSGTISIGLNLNQNAKLNHRYEMEFVEDERCSQILSNFFRRKRAEKS